jgi:hypothetical protein
MTRATMRELGVCSLGAGSREHLISPPVVHVLRDTIGLVSSVVLARFCELRSQGLNALKPMAPLSLTLVGQEPSPADRRSSSKMLVNETLHSIPAERRCDRTHKEVRRAPRAIMEPAANPLGGRAVPRTTANNFVGLSPVGHFVAMWAHVV